MRPYVSLLVIAAAAAGGCGGSDAPTGPSSGAHLRVTVRPEGPGTAARRTDVRCEALGAGASTRVCRRLGRLEARDLTPASRDTACTQLYGGRAVATVTGTLRGRRVRARFSLRDGCEIARWRRSAVLLGPLPGGLPVPRAPRS
jgi:hypothetical protein